MRGQLRPRKASGRDRDRARADRLAACDIVRRVADDIDLGPGEIDRVFLARPLLRHGPELIAIVMIVGKSAEFEKAPDAVVRELELRAPPQVAGQEGEDVLRPGLQSWQQFCHAREERSLALRQFIRQEFEIEFEEQRGRLLRHRDLLLAQNLVDDAGVGLARDLDATEVVDHAELQPEHLLERFDAGAAGVDQRPIDVEKEEAFGN